jgi:hypothetical protein
MQMQGYAALFGPDCREMDYMPKLCTARPAMQQSACQALLSATRHAMDRKPKLCLARSAMLDTLPSLAQHAIAGAPLSLAFSHLKL